MWITLKKIPTKSKKYMVHFLDFGVHFLDFGVHFFGLWGTFFKISLCIINS